jgi:uncharacterized protein
MVWEQLSGSGRIVSYVVVHRSFHPGFNDEVPYIIANILLDGTDGRMVIRSNLLDIGAKEISVGIPVVVEFDDVTESFTVPKFRRAHVC